MVVYRRFGSLVLIILNINLKLACCYETKNESDNTEKKYIYKCCPNSFIVYGKECIEPTDDFKIDFSNIEIFTYYLQNTGLYFNDVYQIKVSQDYSINDTNSDYMAEYFLTEEELLSKLSIPNAVVRWQSISREDFCLDYEKYIDDNNTTMHLVFRFKVAFNKQDHNPKEFYIKAGALLVSCVFLAIVLLVYCILPQLQNLAGKVLMANAVSLICAYALLATMILIAESSQDVTTQFCVTLSSAIYFFFMATFFWMNVMSWDLWKSFSRMVDFRHPNTDVRPSTFHLYSLYAWGMPSCMTTMFVVFNQYHLPGVIAPNIPEFGCFIDEPEKRLYFYLPMSILISCNWILFLLTAINLWRFYKTSEMVHNTNSCLPLKHRANRQRFTMYVKFSLLMGISFILEGISSYMPTLSVWYITDMYNMLIGVAFFVIFVCKRTILRKLIKKLQYFCNKSSKTCTGKVVHRHTSKATVYNFEMTQSRV